VHGGDRCLNEISPRLTMLPTSLQNSIVKALTPELQTCSNNSKGALCSTHLRMALINFLRQKWYFYKYDVTKFTLDSLLEDLMAQNATFGFRGNANLAESYFLANQGLEARGIKFR
jgi:hypothetical protein